LPPQAIRKVSIALLEAIEAKDKSKNESGD
jgi:hypothetical protein